MTYGHRTGYRADPLRDRIVAAARRPGPAARASTSPTWARSARTACCTPRPRRSARDVRALGDGVRGPAGRRRRRRGRRAAHRAVRPPPRRRRRWSCSTRRRCAAPPRRASGSTRWTRTRATPPSRSRRRWRRGAGDRGADLVFQCRGRSRRARAGAAPAAPPGHRRSTWPSTPTTAPRCALGAEFHHNGLGGAHAPRSAACPAAPATPGTASGSRRRRRAAARRTARRCAST